MWQRLGISLKEPSTWVGIISLLSIVGVHVAPEYQSSIIQVGVSLGALLGVIFKWEPAAKPAPIATPVPENKSLEDLVRENQE